VITIEEYKMKNWYEVHEDRRNYHGNGNANGCTNRFHTGQYETAEEAFEYVEKSRGYGFHRLVVVKCSAEIINAEIAGRDSERSADCLVETDYSNAVERATRAENILSRLLSGFWVHMMNEIAPEEAMGDQVTAYWEKYNAETDRIDEVDSGEGLVETKKDKS